MSQDANQPLGIPGAGLQSSGIPGTGVDPGQPSPSGVSFQKAQPAVQSPAAPQGPTYELASWGRRAVAAIIDGAVVGAVVFLVIGVLLAAILHTGHFSESDAPTSDDFIGFVWALFLILIWTTVVVLIYAPTYMWRTNGKTLGKQLLGIRVVRADGVRMTFWFAVFREFLVKGLLGSVASSFTLYLYALLDVLWPLWDSEHRAIHDHIARTRVVRD